MTWLQLYNYLYDQAHKLENIGKFNWQEEIVLHDCQTGEERGVDIFCVGDKTVLTINNDVIFQERTI
jgi:hypothetical protein